VRSPLREEETKNPQKLITTNKDTSSGVPAVQDVDGVEEQNYKNSYG
jgi:hypothetical protein